MKLSRLNKIYVSNFLTGLVFWYGIEKLFMKSIGISATGVGVVTAIVLAVMVLFDIPAGILADRWSRKGTLVLSALFLAISSFTLGSSHSLLVYIIGDMCYALYIVCSSGTYQALIYDTLHEAGRSSDYSRVNGRAYGLFLVGAGVGNVAGGFISTHHTLATPFLISVVPCLLNIAVMLTMYEPTFHKTEGREAMLLQFRQAAGVILKHRGLQALALILTVITVIELFKLDFGQLYLLRYVSSAQIIGILWAVYAFLMAYGSSIGHYFRDKLTLLVVGTTVPVLLMALIDNWFSIVLFMVQVIAAAALINQIDATIQDNTPSRVRTSILSTIYTAGRIIAIPASILLGYTFRNYDALVAVRLVALVAGGILLYWLYARRFTTAPASS